MLALLSAIAVTSLVAVGWELAGTGCKQSQSIRYALAGITLLGSWLMLGTLFSFHYAHMYYRAPADARPLRFPGNSSTEPDLWDFLYFSFTIAVAAQTSDVIVGSPSMRRVVLGQSVLSFLFNVALLGGMVNVAATLLRP